MSKTMRQYRTSISRGQADQSTNRKENPMKFDSNEVESWPNVQKENPNPNENMKDSRKALE